MIIPNSSNAQSDNLDESTTKAIEIARRRLQVEYQDAIIGNGAGVVNVPGFDGRYYVRLATGGISYGQPIVVKRKPGNESSIYIQDGFECILVKDGENPDDWVIESTPLSSILINPVSNNGNPIESTPVVPITLVSSGATDAIVSSIDIDDTMTGYSRLELHLTIRSLNFSNLDRVFIQFNNDTTTSTSNYRYQYAIANATSRTDDDSINVYASATGFQCPANDIASELWGSYRVVIHNPGQSAHKNATWSGGYSIGTSGGETYETSGFGIWENTDAITSIQIALESGSIEVGTRYTLYGYT